MSKQPNTGQTAHEQNKPDRPQSAVVLLLGDIANTTWRMFVPTIGLVLGGYALDNQLSTTPWGVLVGAVLGFSLAVWLVVRQVKELHD